MPKMRKILQMRRIHTANCRKCRHSRLCRRWLKPPPELRKGAEVHWQFWQPTSVGNGKRVFCCLICHQIKRVGRLENSKCCSCDSPFFVTFTTIGVMLRCGGNH